MRNLGVEIAAQFLYDFMSFLVFDLLHQPFQCFIAFQDAGLGQLTKRHLLSIITNFFHLAGHHLHVENEFDQILHWLVQIRLHFGLVLIFLLGFLLLLVNIVFLLIVFVVHLNLSISSFKLFMQLSLILLYSMKSWKARNQGLLSRYAYSSPTCEEIEVLGSWLGLEDLQDVEFIVIASDIWLIKSCWVGFVSFSINSEILGWRCKLIDRNLPF